MRFTVKDTSAGFMAETIKRAKNIEFASIVALTRTAQKVKQAEVELLQAKIDRPTRFTLNSLMVKPATKADPTASVETKQGFGSVPAGRYLSPLVDGGPRRMKSSEHRLGFFWVPGEFADLDGSGNIKGSTIGKILSQLQLRGATGQNTTGSKRSKGKRKSQAFFIKGNIVFLRVRQTYSKTLGGDTSREDETRPYLYLLKRAPTYQKLIPFFETAEQVTDQTLSVELLKAMDEFVD